MSHCWLCMCQEKCDGGIVSYLICTDCYGMYEEHIAVSSVSVTYSSQWQYCKSQWQYNNEDNTVTYREGDLLLNLCSMGVRWSNGNGRTYSK